MRSKRKQFQIQRDGDRWTVYKHSSADIPWVLTYHATSRRACRLWVAKQRKTQKVIEEAVKDFRRKHATSL